MNYDMYWVITPPEVKNQYDAASRVFYDAVRVRNKLPEDEHGDWSEYYPEMQHVIFQRECIGAIPPNASNRYHASQDAVRRAYVNMCEAEINYFNLSIFDMPRYVNAMFHLNMAYSTYDTREWPKVNEPVNQIAVELRDNADLIMERRLDLADDTVEAALEKLCGVEVGQIRWYGGDWPDGEWIAATPDQARAAIDYVRRCDAYLAEHPEAVDEDNSSVIPAHKFSNNDGWHVTPREITAALAAYRISTTNHITEVLVSCGVIAVTSHVSELDDHLKRWNSWITFMEGAIANGGFKVH